MRVISLDFETFYSDEFSVKVLGNWKYARDPRVNPYLISVSDGKENWAGSPADFNFDSLEGALLLSHHAAFDQEIALAAKERGEFVIPGIQPFGMRHWLCTLNMSAFLWNVRSLGEACEMGLGISVNKEVRGRAKGKTPEDMKREGWWNDMIQYGRLDAQHCWNLWDKHNAKWPESERILSQMTTDQGRYGLRIDVPSLQLGIDLMEKVIFQARVNLPWIARGRKPASPLGIAEECKMVGIPPPPVKKHDPEAAEEWELQYAPKHKFVLALRNIRKAKKTLATLNTIKLRLREDDTVSFSLKYAGAHTLRWAGDAGWNLQNQNKEPLFVDPDFSFVFDKKACQAKAKEFDFEHADRRCVGALKDGTTFFDPRGVTIARPGMKLASVDLSQIEPRVLNKIVGNEALLEKIRQGMGIYEAFARTALGWTGGELKSEDKKLYALSKADVLGLGFRAGWEKFITVAWTMAGVDITEGDEDFAREASVDGKIHRRTKLGEEWMYESAPEGVDVPLWSDWKAKTGDLAIPDWQTCVFVQQIRKRRGEEVKVIGALQVYGMRSRITVTQFRANNTLIVGLWESLDKALEDSVGQDLVIEGPNGFKLTYRKVRRERRKRKNSDTGEEYETTVFTAEIGGDRYALHGGVLTENWVQFLARLIFAERMVALDEKLQAEDPRQRVLFSVHDEAVAEILDPADPATRAKELEAVMSVTPSWFAGCPVGAEAKILTRYAK